MPSDYSITTFDNSSHRIQVIELWRSVFGYETAHNNPGIAIDRKISEDDGLFFVAMADRILVGTVLCGYDGHRGWVYSLAVLPSHRCKGIGQRLFAHAESALTEKGCLKINLQILPDNDEVVRFYQKLGFVVEPRINMGKVLFREKETSEG